MLLIVELLNKTQEEAEVEALKTSVVMKTNSKGKKSVTQLN